MSKEIRNRIKENIQASGRPIDSEKISKEVGYGWGTVLRYALELVIDEEVKGLNTTNGWVFWMEE